MRAATGGQWRERSSGVVWENLGRGRHSESSLSTYPYLLHQHLHPLASFIHSLSAAYPNYTRVRGSLCLSQASLGIKAGYTLDGVPTHRRAHTHTHSHSLTQSHTTDNLEMPINIPCMSLDWGRKPEYPEETPEA
ncbi:hypothetical protein QTP70_031033, partial [Hemibagrus guttatus]